MSTNWEKFIGRSAPKPIVKGIKAADEGETAYDKKTVYFYTDGCLKEADKRYGSWSVIGIAFDPVTDKWEEVYHASASSIPAKCSGHMELCALVNALQNIQGMQDSYPERTFCIRTDHEGLQSTISRYMATYPESFKGDKLEMDAGKLRQGMRKDKLNSDKAKDYARLFDEMDKIGKLAWHYKPGLKVEWVSRDYDLWIAKADANAQNANGYPGWKC